MQLTLCGVLLVSVGLAALLSRSRSKALQFDLGPPLETGVLRVRMPNGWIVVPMRSQGTAQVSAGEPANEERARMLLVGQQANVTADAKTFLSSHLQVPSANFERFDFLGQQGYLFALASPLRLGERASIDAGFYACTVLPSRVAVVVELRGGTAFGPTGRKMLRKVVGAFQQLPGWKRVPLPVRVQPAPLPPPPEADPEPI